jgi:maleate isomerase
MRPGGAMDPTIALESVRAFADPPAIDAAATLLAAAPLHAIGVAFTGSSYVRGADDDDKLRQRLEEHTRGIPVAITCAAAVAGLRMLGAERLALIHPPWFSSELSALGAEYFRRQGFDVVHHAPAGLPSAQQAIHPGALYAWARANVPPSAEAAFIGGNGFRAVGVIQALEEDLGIPILTANQALFWRLLRLAGTRVAVPGYGQLFDVTV